MRYTLLCLMLTLLCPAGNNPTRAEDKKAPPPLDAKLRVKVGAKLEVSCHFLLPGKEDQSFENTEYRYAVLDKNGNQVDDVLKIKVPLRTISLPKDKRAVTDETDASIVADKLKSGEEYYFVVSVRNLTGLAKFGADKDELQGEWVATSAEINGEPAPAKVVKRVRFTFKGDTLLMWQDRDDGKPDEGTYKADSRKSPKQLNITIKIRDVAKTLHGIYEVKGDVLKVCYETGDEPENRPTKFATSEEKEEVLIVFKKQKR